MRYPKYFYQCKSISNPSERLKALRELKSKVQNQLDTGVHHWLSGESTRYLNSYKNKIDTEINKVIEEIEVVKQQYFRFGS